MSHHLNLNPHIILRKPRHPNTRPNRPMIGHIPLEVAYHRVDCLIIEREVVRVHPEYLLPALATCMLQVHGNIRKRLVDLCIDLAVDSASFWVPASCCGLVNLRSLRLTNDFRQCRTYPGLSIRYGRQHEQLGCTSNSVRLFGRRHRGCNTGGATYLFDSFERWLQMRVSNPVEAIAIDEEY